MRLCLSWAAVWTRDRMDRIAIRPLDQSVRTLNIYYVGTDCRWQRPGCTDVLFFDSDRTRHPPLPLFQGAGMCSEGRCSRDQARVSTPTHAQNENLTLHSKPTSSVILLVTRS